MGKRKEDQFWLHPCERLGCPVEGWHAHEGDVDVPAEVLAEIPAPSTRRPPTGYDPTPTILVGILSAPEVERAYDAYAADLDENVPGWWEDDETRMVPSLRNRALVRRGEL